MGMSRSRGSFFKKSATLSVSFFMNSVTKPSHHLLDLGERDRVLLDLLEWDRPPSESSSESSRLAEEVGLQLTVGDVPRKSCAR